MLLACENIRFSTLFAAGDVSSPRNVPSAEELGETDVSAGYHATQAKEGRTTASLWRSR